MFQRQREELPVANPEIDAMTPSERVLQQAEHFRLCMEIPVKLWGNDSHAEMSKQEKVGVPTVAEELFVLKERPDQPLPEG